MAVQLMEVRMTLVKSVLGSALMVAATWFPGDSFGASASAGTDKIMALVPKWMDGHYSTRKQYADDQASARKDTQKHRLFIYLLG